MALVVHQNTNDSNSFAKANRAKADQSEQTYLDINKISKIIITNYVDSILNTTSIKSSIFF